MCVQCIHTIYPYNVSIQKYTIIFPYHTSKQYIHPDYIHKYVHKIYPYIISKQYTTKYMHTIYPYDISVQYLKLKAASCVCLWVGGSVCVSCLFLKIF